jgi:hypothetical protein
VTSELKTWERKHYVAGGGDPVLFYVVYGEIDASAPLSRSKYRSNGAPDGIEVMSYGPNMHPDVPGSFRDGYLWDEFVASDPEFAANGRTMRALHDLAWHTDRFYDARLPARHQWA